MFEILSFIRNFANSKFKNYKHNFVVWLLCVNRKIIYSKQTERIQLNENSLNNLILNWMKEKELERQRVALNGIIGIINVNGCCHIDALKNVCAGVLVCVRIVQSNTYMIRNRHILFHSLGTSEPVR